MELQAGADAARGIIGTGERHVTGQRAQHCFQPSSCTVRTHQHCDVTNPVLIPSHAVISLSVSVVKGFVRFFVNGLKLCAMMSVRETSTSQSSTCLYLGLDSALHQSSGCALIQIQVRQRDEGETRF